MLGVVVAGFLLVQFSRELPDAERIRSVNLKVPLRVYSADGVLISEFGNERRIPIDYADTPQSIIDAVLASEDDGFFDHHGIDFRGLLRAALSNAMSGRSGQGASTITMQVARNFFLTRDKTYTRKIKEILLALRLEQILSKQEILSLYINKIFLGHRSYGFGAAAQTYYGTDLHKLSLAQTAMLAGLPKAPSTFNPLRNASRAKARRNYVLGRLFELEKISNAQYKTAISEEVTAEKHTRTEGLNAPHIAEMVRQQLLEQYGEGAYWQGLNVYTTILSKQQVAAQQALRKGLEAYDRRHGFRGAVGKIKLDNLQQQTEQENQGNWDAQLEDKLSIYPNSQEHRPAVVLKVENEIAQLWIRDYANVTLELANAKWAKRHKTADLRGERPTRLQEVFEPGDVVYIKPKLAQATTKTNPEEATVWQLSQLPDVGGSLISVNPSSGEILSLVGGYDFFLNKYNRAVQSIRQPGSNIKPFIYSAAIDHGFTPATLISGAPIVITDPAHGTLWRPENYSGKFYGPTRMRAALGKSMNLVSIRLLRTIGIPYAREYIQRFGIDMSRFSASLTMALGSGGVTPLEMLSAYSVLANGGYKVAPYFIERITDRDGELIFQAPKPEFCDQCIAEYLPKPEIDPTTLQDEDFTPDNDVEELVAEAKLEQEAQQETPQETLSPNYVAPRVMSHANNYLTVSMMRDVIRRGTARKALALNRQDLAGKTGTTNDYVDAWFTGFNSKVATTVWVGFDEPQSMGRGEAGSLAALPIWVDYMSIALKGVQQDNLAKPDYIETRFIDRSTGQTSLEEAPNSMMEYFAVAERTPEYALMRELYPWIDQTNIAENSAIEKRFNSDSYTNESLEPLNAANPLDPSLQDNSRLDPARQNLPQITPLEQSERIKEAEGDTDDLF